MTVHFWKLLVAAFMYEMFFVTLCKGFILITADYVYPDKDGLRLETLGPLRIDSDYSILSLLLRKKRQVPGMGMMPQSVAELQGINQMVRFKPYRFTGRRRMNPELLFPGAVIGDGVSHPVGTFNGIGYYGESDLAGMAPTIYDRLPMANLFQVSYPGLNPAFVDPEAAAAAAGSDQPFLEGDYDSDLETMPQLLKSYQNRLKASSEESDEITDK